MTPEAFEQKLQNILFIIAAVCLAATKIHSPAVSFLKCTVNAVMSTTIANN